MATATPRRRAATAELQAVSRGRPTSARSPTPPDSSGHHSVSQAASGSGTAAPSVSSPVAGSPAPGGDVGACSTTSTGRSSRHSFATISRSPRARTWPDQPRGRSTSGAGRRLPGSRQQGSRDESQRRQQLTARRPEVHDRERVRSAEDASTHPRAVPAPARTMSRCPPTSGSGRRRPRGGGRNRSGRTAPARSRLAMWTTPARS